MVNLNIRVLTLHEFKLDRNTSHASREIKKKKHCTMIVVLREVLYRKRATKMCKILL